MRSPAEGVCYDAAEAQHTDAHDAVLLSLIHPHLLHHHLVCCFRDQGALQSLHTPLRTISASTPQSLLLHADNIRLRRWHAKAVLESLEM